VAVNRETPIQAPSGGTLAPGADAESRSWVEALSGPGALREERLTDLHALLLRAAHREAARRRGWLGSVSGQELDDIAQQAADDALMAILRRLDDYRGESRFTTWAYKFVIFEISGKLARHAWRRQPPAADEAAWERLPERLRARPEHDNEQREVLSLLRTLLASELTDRQREVFVAAALNEESIDVIALRFDSNRNAIYKTLFDARRKLRAGLAAAGHDLER
jgi:RNA polymerase sigma-70 factor (ECF subfamily)